MACIAVLGFAAAIVLGSRWDLGMAMAAIAVLFGQTVLLSGHHEHFSPRKAIRWLSKHQPDAIFACYPHAFESMEFYVDNKELIIFETGQEAELADFLKQKPNAVLAALHPGTVTSRLSKPFRGAEIGRAPNDAAADMLDVIDSLTPPRTGQYYSYSGERLPW